MNQLSLNIALLDGFGFDSFCFSPDNADILALLAGEFWHSFPQLFLFGDAGCGKSHLMQACCYQTQERHGSAAYISLRQLLAYGPAVLEGLDHCALIAVDDIDLAIGDLAWETALFHLINRCRQNGQPLLLAARGNPHGLEGELPDLASRLLWGPIYRVHALDELHALEAFKFRASRRGFEVPDYVVSYIKRRFPRDMQSLMQVLERLDTASLDKGRKITRHFVQETFNLG